MNNSRSVTTERKPINPNRTHDQVRVPVKPRYTREQVRVRRAFVGGLATLAVIGGLYHESKNASAGPNLSQRAAALKTIDGIDTQGILKLPAGINIRKTPDVENVDDQGGGQTNYLIKGTKRPIEVAQPLTSSQNPGWDAIIMPRHNTASAKTIGWVDVDELEATGQASYEADTTRYNGANNVAQVNGNGTISVAENEYTTPALDPNAGLAHYVKPSHTVSN